MKGKKSRKGLKEEKMKVSVCDGPQTGVLPRRNLGLLMCRGAGHCSDTRKWPVRWPVADVYLGNGELDLSGR